MWGMPRVPHVPRTGALALTLVLAIALFGSACSGSSTDGTSVETTDDSAVLPFDAVLVELFGTTDTDAYLDSTERRASELIVECMNDAGFEFAIPPQAPATETPDVGDLAAAREIGFGIISGYRSQLAAATIDSGDPNLAYLSTLTAAQVDEFFLALDGTGAEAGQLPDDGCRVEASDRAFADWNSFREALPNSYVLDEERDSHPEWLDAQAAWRECMAERGFDYPNPEAIRSAVVTTMRETVEEQFPGGRLPLVPEGDGFVLDPSLDELFVELVEFERAAAVANIECNEPVAEQRRAVEQAVQQAYVERHRDAIDRLLAGS